jgi:hypothetical protein
MVDRYGSRSGSEVQGKSVSSLSPSCSSSRTLLRVHEQRHQPIAQTSVTADDSPPSVPFDPTTVVEPAAYLGWASRHASWSLLAAFA